MRKWVLGFLTLVVLGVSVFLGAQPGPGKDGPEQVLEQIHGSQARWPPQRLTISSS